MCDVRGKCVVSYSVIVTVRDWVFFREYFGV